MAGVHGEHMYGYVDRVPGLCYVATQFFHINFVPLFPVGTYLVMEGSQSQKGFQGKRIGMNAKSVLLGYFRGWVGLAAIILFGICSVQAGTILLDGQMNDGLRAAVIAGLVLVYGCVWWAIIGSHKSWILAYLVVLLATGGYLWWDHENPPPPPPVPANPFNARIQRVTKERAELPTFFLWAHGCLFALSVVRAFDKAGRGRAYDLGAMLGLTDDQMDEIWEAQHAAPEPKLDEYPT